ncbi:MAG: hypothetical protein QM401_06895 [Bacillota bacterium]|nr:hypothetical protein [Bacillota bacterium]
MVATGNSRKINENGYTSRPVTYSLSTIFDTLERTSPGKGGELQLTDGIRLLLKESTLGYSVKLTDKEKRYDMGNMGSYSEAFVDFVLQDEKYGYQLRQYLHKKLNL